MSAKPIESLALTESINRSKCSCHSGEIPVLRLGCPAFEHETNKLKANKNKEKARIFDAICALDPSVLDEQSLLIGDFNTGRHFLDEQKKTFHCAEYFDRLQDIGWIDSWRSRNEKTREFSWFRNAGNGFRLDHAFASSELNVRIESVGYNHIVRETGLSDHSAMIVDVASNKS